MADHVENEPADEEDGEEGSAAEETENLVNQVADYLEVAEQVLVEKSRRDGRQYESGQDEPSIQELFCIAQLVMLGRSSGAFESTESATKKMFKQMDTLIDSKVKLAMLQKDEVARQSRSFPSQRPMVPPVPGLERPGTSLLPVRATMPPPPRQDMLLTLQEKMLNDNRACSCMKSTGAFCKDCQDRNCFFEVVGKYMCNGTLDS